MIYKCDTCGRKEESEEGPPKCYCAMPKYVEIMKPIDENKEEVNEYLVEG
jgi:hypothetical protein